MYESLIEDKDAQDRGWFIEWEEDGIRKIQLKSDNVLSDLEADEYKGEFITEDDYDLILDESADVYKPVDVGALGAFIDPSEVFNDMEDRLLVSFRRGVIDQEICEVAKENLKGAARESQNRGIAAGKVDVDKLAVENDRVQLISPYRATYKTKDGHQSKTNIANVVKSGIIGYFDRNPRTPYCRTTAYTREFEDRFKESLPFIQAIDHWYSKLIPSSYRKQKRFAEEYSTSEKGFMIEGTAFTTCTVNKNFRTAVHKDAGDLEEGFGNLTVLENGNYEGGYTVFPKFRVGVDCRQGDFLGMDVHEWHGNTEIVSEYDNYERVSVVCYYREKMKNCDSWDEEMQKRDQWKKKKTERKQKRKSSRENSKDLPDEVDGVEELLNTDWR